MTEQATDSDDLRQQITAELTRSQDDLLISLVPEHLDGRLYSRGGLIAHGRQILRTAIAQVRGPICLAYRTNKDSVRDSVDAAVLIVPIIAASAIGVPVLSLAALIAKIGIAQLCRDRTDDA